jgi:anti-anti-sigma factor
MENGDIQISDERDLAAPLAGVKVLSSKPEPAIVPSQPGSEMANETFAIEEEVIAGKGIVILRMAGNVSARTFERLEAAIKAPIARGIYRIVIDLSLVGYISSSAAGVFMNALSEVHELKGDIVLLNPTPNVREIMDLLNLSHVFRIVDDREAALNAF